MVLSALDEPCGVVHEDLVPAPGNVLRRRSIVKSAFNLGMHGLAVSLCLAVARVAAGGASLQATGTGVASAVLGSTR